METKTVLVVEDDEVTLAINTHILEGEEYKVLSAKDGIEGLNFIESQGNHIDVILLDKIMPKMNGTKMVGRLREDERFKNIPVIMITGSDDLISEKESRKSGANYYITKPIQSDTLISLVEKAIKKSK